MTISVYKLSELCEIVSSKRVFAASYQNTGIPFFRGKEISQLSRGETVSPELFISHETYEDVIRRTGAVGVGEILLTAVGTLGNPYQVEASDLPFYFKDGNVVWLRKFVERIDPTYLYFWLKSEYGRRKVLDTAIGSTQAALTITALSNIEIPLPSKVVQSQVVKLISSINRAISVNRQISANLERIAQTIFNSWFVDFDPVKAKLVGDKPVGMDDATAALFPDSFEDSELGLIPSGWKLQSLSNIGEFRNGLAMQKFPVVDVENVLPVIKIAQLRAGNTSGADLASGLIDPKFVVSDGDVLFSWSGTLEIEHWAGGPGALNQHLFKVLGKTVPNWFIFSSSRSHLPEFRKIASGKATTMGHIQRSHLDEAKVAVPPAALLEKVDGLLSALVAQKVSLLVENRTLAELRDALLPRLISGELQIPEEMLVS